MNIFAKHFKMVREVYIKNKSLIREEANDDGELTFYIEAEICLDHTNWEDVVLIVTEEL